jgi:hypothetical protein
MKEKAKKKNAIETEKTLKLQKEIDEKEKKY